MLKIVIIIINLTISYMEGSGSNDIDNWRHFHSNTLLNVCFVCWISISPRVTIWHNAPYSPIAWVCIRSLQYNYEIHVRK